MSKSKFKLPRKSKRNRAASQRRSTKHSRQSPANNYLESAIAPHRNSRKIGQPESNLAARSGSAIARLFVVWSVLVLGAFGLGAKLYYLQVVNPIVKYEQAPEGKRLTQIAKDQQTTRLKFYIPRRQIVDRQQNILATDRITYTLYIHPHLFKRNSQPVPAEEIAAQLADILGTKTKEELLTIFAKQDWGIRLSGDLPESVKEKITAMQIDGLDLKQNYTRFYPTKKWLRR